MKLRKQYPLLPEYSDMLEFKCPACGHTHCVSIGPKSFWNPPSWTFNGDLERPTINPSVLVTHKMPDGTKVCHSFIRDGRIQFLGDCTHHMAGQTVDLPDFTEEELKSVP